MKEKDPIEEISGAKPGGEVNPVAGPGLPAAKTDRKSARDLSDDELDQLYEGILDFDLSGCW